MVGVMFIKGFHLIGFLDGLFITGFTLITVAGLIWVIRNGGFDMFGYSGYYVFNHKSKKYSSYLDYQEKKNEERQKEQADYSLLVVGIVFFCLSIVINMFL